MASHANHEGDGGPYGPGESAARPHGSAPHAASPPDPARRTPPAPPGVAPEPEQIGPYLVYESLGSGGMATVRRAELRGIAGFRRMVALKQLHPHLAEIPEIRALFVHEARLGSLVRHANVAQTFDFGKAGATYFIAMEYVRGPTLAQVARQCATAAGPIPLAIVLGIISQLCDALDHIHQLRDPRGRSLGIVHRDVSPPNVIISNTGLVKLIDFGTSKSESSQIHTQAGALRGKFGYCAPEYVRGALDARSDLFGLGVIAHELIANRPLFLGRNELDTLTRVREMPIPPLSSGDRDVPRELERVVMTALHRDPDQRWQTARAMRAALAEIARASDVHVGPPQIVEWVEWAFSQRAATDAGDARTTPGRSDAGPAAAASPALTVAAHELSTVVVLDLHGGSAVTRVFHRDLRELASRRPQARLPSVPTGGPTRRFLAPPSPRSTEPAPSPRPTPDRAATATATRPRYVKTVPRPARPRRWMRAPSLPPEGHRPQPPARPRTRSPVLRAMSIPAGLAPMRRRMASAATPPAVPRATVATGAASARALRARQLGLAATQPAVVVAPVPAAAPAPAVAPAPAASPAPAALPLAAPKPTPRSVPVVSPAQPGPMRAQHAPIEPPPNPPLGAARRPMSTGVVVVAATRRAASLSRPARTTAIRRRELTEVTAALLAAWPAVVIVCAALTIAAILLLRS